MSKNRIITVFGEQVEILVSSESTRNALFVGVQTSPPGGGPPPHRHRREDELFTVLEGDYELFDGQRWTPFLRGEYAFMTRGQYHTFRNRGSTVGRMHFVVTPGGLDEYFEAIAPLALPQDLARLLAVNTMFGIEIVPPHAPEDPALYAT